MSKFTEKKVASRDEWIPLTNVQRLMDVINNRRDNGIKHPQGMPEGQQEGAKWWIKLLEPRMQFEVDEISKRHMPYQERLADCLVKYYKHTDAEQRRILGWIRDGVAWRGDSIEFMEVRAKVTPAMKIDRDGLMRAMKAMTGKVMR